MDLTTILTDELTDMREATRADKNFTLSDQIRNELDRRGSFCFDGPNGQVVYHLGEGYTREVVKNNIRSIDESFKK